MLALEVGDSHLIEQTRTGPGKGEGALMQGSCKLVLWTIISSVLVGMTVECMNVARRVKQN